MDKRTLVAIALSALVLFSWQAYMGKAYKNQALVIEDDQSDSGAYLSSNNHITSQVVERGRATDTTNSVTKAQIAEEQTTVIETEKFIVTLSNVGGCIKSIALKDYQEQGTGEPLILANIQGNLSEALELSGTSNEEGMLNLVKLAGSYVPNRSFMVKSGYNFVEYSTEFRPQVTLTKRYEFHNSSDSIDLELMFSNKSDEEIQLDYVIVAASNISMDSAIDKRYTQIVAEIDGKVRRDRGAKNGGKEIPGTVLWAGVQNKYFSILAKPMAPAAGIVAKMSDANGLISEIQMSQFSVSSNSNIAHQFTLFAGLTNDESMKAYGMEKAANYGAFWGIGKVLVAGLRIFHKIFKNWGVAIILLSILTNLALLPFTRHSYMAMKKMQAVQPHMEALRAEHKDNPQKLNKEMMGLYKKHGVNPMGGCLPMFLQMPVFFALYKALLRSIELRGSSFLWIKDLSMPDGVPLPFTLPLIGNSINVLPLMMMVAMVFQQKASSMNRAPQSDQARQQQQMMMFMPLMFGFILYNFPAGLVLYWLTNTILTTVEQRAVLKQA